MIEEKSTEAVSLYKEALALAEEHSDDFRLDPLMNIHILHNLAEILPVGANTVGANPVGECPLNGQHLTGSPGKEVSKKHGIEKCEQRVFKRRKVNRKGKFTTDTGNPRDNTSDIEENILKINHECDDVPQTSCSSVGDKSLSTACENMKQKFLSAFSSRLFSAQEDFRKSYMQVYTHFYLAFCGMQICFPAILCVFFRRQLL